jgi:phenylalanyl-tRNA synthetase beta chain
VMLANPLSSDLNAMRQSLLFGGLSSVAWNINRQNQDLRLYEFGNIYFYNGKDGSPYPRVEDYTEIKCLDLFLTGNTNRKNWNYKSEPTDFFRVKSFTEMVLARLGLKPENMQTGESTKKYFAESVTFLNNNKILAEIGRISAGYLQKFDIRQDVYYAHIDWDMLTALVKNHSISFHELPKYPAVRRDLALLVDRSVKFSQVRDIAFKTERNLLKEVGLFDVYENDSLGNNKKSYAVSFILRDDRQTLTDKNIDKVMNNLIRAYGKDLDAQIR